MIAHLVLRQRLVMTSLLMAGACKSDGNRDRDKDGFIASMDCNDDDASVHPAAIEICNAVDDNCDGVIDEGVTIHYYLDADGDGYGTDEDAPACSSAPNTATNTFDCDDSDADVHPGVPEVCDNGKDEDCDGRDRTTPLWYADADGDGYGDSATTSEECNAPGRFVADASDCDDGDAAIHPDAQELCDNAIDDDCDEVIASGADTDGDAWYADMCVGGYDCDDGDAAIHPDATEKCDEIDSDCNGHDCPLAIHLSDADATYTGPEYGQAGWAVAGAGDVNGDGYADVLVGAPTSANEDGSAHLVLGGPSPASASLLAADATYTGWGSREWAGLSVDAAGDVDGDGYGDILVGADWNSEAGLQAGIAYLVLGSPSPASASLSTADARYTGEVAGDYAAWSVAGAEDVNGDSYADFLVGAKFNGDGGLYAGAAYLVLGGPSPAPASLSTADARYTGEAPGDNAGWSVAGGGDVDGDGYSDVLVDAVSNSGGGKLAGAAYLVLGAPSPDSMWLSAADAKYSGESVGGAGVVAGAGDVNGDGYDDVLIGGAGASYNGGQPTGVAYLVLGGPSPASAPLSAADAAYVGETKRDDAGWSVDGAGDVDADGYDDILVGAYGNSVNDWAGAAYLVLGGPSPASESLWEADAKYLGEVRGDQAGYSVAGAGDVDADGYADVLVGANYNDNAGTSAGAAYLMLRGAL